MPSVSALFGTIPWTGGLIAVLALAVTVLALLCTWLYRLLRRATAIRDRLIAANRDMEAATKAKGQFLVSMNSEIQESMKSLTGFIEILAQRELQHCTPELKEEMEGLLDHIKTHNEDILAVLNDVFDYIKIDANLLEIESVPMSIRQVVHDICHVEKPHIVAKHLDFSVQYNGEIPPTILSDPVRIQQILTHLIRHAVRFTDKGTITVLCEALAGDDDTGTPPQNTATQTTEDTEQDSFSASPMQLKISVIDTGVGIPTSHIRDIFKPFKRTDSSVLNPASDTALGLNIAMRLARLLDGTITVESIPGQGSTFSLLLNVYASMGPPPILSEHREQREDSRLLAGLDIRQPNVKTESSPDEVLPLQGLRVLVVEDMAVNQVILAALLREAGAQVELTDNGAMGVQKIMQDIDNGLFFDVILMDMRMPVMDGYEATAYLRKHHYHRPIIAVTALTVEGDWEKTLEAGCDDCLAKPVDPLAMIETIKKHVRTE